MTIIKVDNTSSLRRMIASYLTQERFRVLTVADGQEALRPARRDPRYVEAVFGVGYRFTSAR